MPLQPNESERNVRGFLSDMTTHPGEYTYLERLHGVGGSSLSAINNSRVGV
jgi:hypothetical protein